LIIAKIETIFDITLLTQNIDDLHEQAGSTAVLDLQNEIRKARSINRGCCKTLVILLFSYL
jgi:NAD-dependent deacetylase